MDRRYYALRAALVVVAVITVGLTSNVGSHKVAHAINTARYSAPAQIEDAISEAVRQFLGSLFRRRG